MKEEKQHRGCLLSPFLAGLLTLSLSLATAPSFAQARPANPSGQKGTPAQPTSAEERLAGAWTLFYEGKHAAAVTAAEALYKDKSEPIRLEAKHIAARALFAGAATAEATKKDSGKAGFAKANQLEKELERSTNNANLVRLSIRQALGLDYRKEYASASSLLEKAVERNLSSTATAEAAIELAGVLAKQGKFDEADKALNFVGPFLDKQVRVEMTEAEAAPFRQAAKVMQAKMVYYRSAGMKEFEQAESLRQQKKYPEAVAAFRSIVKSYPTSDFAPRSEYTIGLCLLAGQGQKQALEHWQKFIASAPAGPWRGQSLLAIIDCYLNDLDLANAAKFSTLAQSNLDDALNDEKASPSWQPVQFNILLRAGIISYCQGDPNAAAEAFSEAQTHAPSKKIANNIEPLVTAARAGKSVIPDDVKAGVTGTSERRTTGPPASPQERVALALSIGVIHLATGQFDNAQTIFDCVTGTPAIPAKAGAPGQPAKPAMQGATPAQRAFAIFGKGVVLQASANDSPVKLEQAREQFLASIKAFGDGSWHDDSFYRVATIAYDELTTKFGKPSDSSATAVESAISENDGKKIAQPAKPITSAEKEAIAKAKKERLANLFKGQQEVLSIWQELLKRYPTSSRAEYAGWAIVQLQYEMAQTVPAEKSTQLFKDTVLSAGRFCESWPRSQWAGSAINVQISVALERMFDLDLAKTLAASGEEWAKQMEAQLDAKGQPKEDSSLPPWALRDRQPLDIQADLYQVHLHNGLVAYLGQQYDRAAKAFEAARPFAPDLDVEVVHGHVPKGIDRLIDVAKESQRLTPDQALDNKHGKASLILQLADLYDLEEDYVKSADLVNLILTGTVTATAEQKSWATFRRGRASFCLDWDHRDPIAAKKDYLAAVDLAPKASWAYQGLFLAGNIAFNTEHDVDGAVALWKRLLKDYPNCPEAHRAAYYIGVSYELTNQPEKAKEAFDAFLKAFPDSPFTEIVQQQHFKNIQELLKEKEKRS